MIEVHVKHTYSYVSHISETVIGCFQAIGRTIEIAWGPTLLMQRKRQFSVDVKVLRNVKHNVKELIFYRECGVFRYPKWYNFQRIVCHAK